MSYPVHFSVRTPEQFTRLQLGLRILALIALGAVGLSLAGLYGVLYLLLPVTAAVRIAARGSSTSYASEDGPRILFALRWLAAGTAWLGFATEKLPAEAPAETVVLEIEDSPSQTPGSAAARVLLGLPALLLLALLWCVGGLVFLWAALSILFGETMPSSAHAYLVGLQRYAYRLLAYQAALVDAYPPFALAETPRMAPPIA